MLEMFPDGFTLIGDPAYEPTEIIVPIYHGICKLNPEIDNFNYYDPNAIFVLKWHMD
jgi:hypothetical protein